jgi:predicted lipid-binding transport protein (Tim44 family)
VAGLIPALIAALVIGLLNATVGLFLKIITFPLSILTLGLFLLVINGVMILIASSVRARISRKRLGASLLGRSGSGASRYADQGCDEGRVADYCETAGCGVASPSGC